MLDPSHPIAKLLEDGSALLVRGLRVPLRGVELCAKRVGNGAESPSDDHTRSEPGPEQHVTGQELCEAIRRYALEQYGYMAKTVLNSWGIHGTSDFGEIVFNLIRIGQMRKTPSERSSISTTFTISTSR